MRYRVFAKVGLLMSVAVALASLAQEDTHTPDQVTGNYPAVNLFRGSTDILGKPFEYPDCAPEVHAVIITLAPGQIGQEHQHLTPLFGYILSGEIAVDYQHGDGVTNVYKAGDAMMEAMDVMHHGYNPGSEPAQLLAVYMQCADQNGSN